MLRGCGLLVLVTVACVGTEPALDFRQVPVATRCELPEPTVLRREDNSVLHMWELPMSPVWFGETLPVTPGYLAYAKREFWKQPFERDGRPMRWEDAIDLFRDPTGRPGPANWELGACPAGQDDYPVTGVSWYEAAAYAEYAGKALPTLYHWSLLATPHFSASVVPRSNFSGRAPLAIGASHGMNRYGAYDMAGKVKEWCANAAGAERRYILGGAWNEPVYMFNDADARSPFDRDMTFGFRCMKLEPDALPSTVTGAIEFPSRLCGGTRLLLHYRNFS